MRILAKINVLTNIFDFSLVIPKHFLLAFQLDVTTSNYILCHIKLGQ